MPRHPTAIISNDAQIAENVEIGPFSVIEGPVKISPGVKIGGHSRICGDTEIGENTTIGWGSIIGDDPQDLTFDPSTPSGVRIGPNNAIREHVTIHRGSKPGSMTRIGSHNFLMTGVHLAHDVLLGDHNILANNVLLAGHIHVGNRAFLGGGAGFHQFIRIGDLAMVQGNAAISQDVPPYCIAHGQNQLAGLNTIGLRRAGFDPETRLAIKQLFLLCFRPGIPLSKSLEQATQRPWPEAAQHLLNALAHPSKKGTLSR